MILIWTRQTPKFSWVRSFDLATCQIQLTTESLSWRMRHIRDSQVEIRAQLHFVSPHETQRACHRSAAPLIQPSQEPLSKNSSRHIDWKSLQWHQSTYCLHSVLYFFFSLQLSKRGSISILFWHPCSGPLCAGESSLKYCLWFTNTQ